MKRQPVRLSWPDDSETRFTVKDGRGTVARRWHVVTDQFFGTGLDRALNHVLKDRELDTPGEHPAAHDEVVDRPPFCRRCEQDCTNGVFRTEAIGDVEYEDLAVPGILSGADLGFRPAQTGGIKLVGASQQLVHPRDRIRISLANTNTQVQAIEKVPGAARLRKTGTALGLRPVTAGTLQIGLGELQYLEHTRPEQPRGLVGGIAVGAHDVNVRQ